MRFQSEKAKEEIMALPDLSESVSDLIAFLQGTIYQSGLISKKCFVMFEAQLFILLIAKHRS